MVSYLDSGVVYCSKPSWAGKSTSAPAVAPEAEVFRSMADACIKAFYARYLSLFTCHWLENELSDGPSSDQRARLRFDNVLGTYLRQQCIFNTQALRENSYFASSLYKYQTLTEGQTTIILSVNGLHIKYSWRFFCVAMISTGQWVCSIEAQVSGNAQNLPAQRRGQMFVQPTLPMRHSMAESYGCWNLHSIACEHWK